MESSELASKAKARSQKNKRKEKRSAKIHIQKEGESSHNSNDDDKQFDSDKADEGASKSSDNRKIGSRQKKAKEPIFEEDIIDGFAFLSFMSYEDLQDTAKLLAGSDNEDDVDLNDDKNVVNNTKINKISNNNNNVLNNKNGEYHNKINDLMMSSRTIKSKPKTVTTTPTTIQNNDQRKNAKCEKSKSTCNTNKNNIDHKVTYTSIQSRINNSHINNHLEDNHIISNNSDDNCWSRLTNGPLISESKERFSDASSRTSSGRGYMCDSESEDDRVSDAGFDSISTNVKLNHLVTSTSSETKVVCSRTSDNHIVSDNHNKQLPLLPDCSTSSTITTESSYLLNKLRNLDDNSCSSATEYLKDNSQSAVKVSESSGSCSSFVQDSPNSSVSSPPPPLLVANSHVCHPNPSSVDNKCPPSLTPPFLSANISPVTVNNLVTLSSTLPVISSSVSLSNSSKCYRSNATPVKHQDGLQNKCYDFVDSPSTTFNNHHHQSIATKTISSNSIPRVNVLSHRTSSSTDVPGGYTPSPSTSVDTLSSLTSSNSNNWRTNTTYGLSQNKTSPPSAIFSHVYSTSKSAASVSSSSSSLARTSSPSVVSCSSFSTNSKSRTSTTPNSIPPIPVSNVSSSVPVSPAPSTSSTSSSSHSKTPPWPPSSSSRPNSASSSKKHRPSTPSQSSLSSNPSAVSPFFPRTPSTPSPLLASNAGIPVSAGHHGMFAPPLPPPAHPLPPVSVPPGSNPANPAFTSRDSLFSPTNQQDLLRRELDSRFLASHDRSINIPPPPYMRTEMHQHQHQHQHTHLHQHNHLIPPITPLPNSSPQGSSGVSAAALGSSLIPQPSAHLFDKFSKLETPFNRQNQQQQLGFTGYPGISPLLAPGNPASSATPFNTPNQMAAFQPKLPNVEKSKSFKAGKWNAMHVRIAWEIYNHQQKQQVDQKGSNITVPSTAALSSGKAADSLLRPPSHLFPLLHNRPMDIPPFSASALLGAASGHPRNPFDASVHPAGMFMSPNSSPLGFSPFPRPGFPNIGLPGSSSFGGLGSLGSALLGSNRDLPSFTAGMEQWNRLLRNPSSFPTPPPHSWHLKGAESIVERERLLREEQEKGRENQLRKPTPTALTNSNGKEKKDLNKSKETIDRERERDKQRERDRDIRLMHPSYNSLPHDLQNKEMQRNGLTDMLTSHHDRRNIENRCRESSRSPIRNNFRGDVSVKNSRPESVKSDSAFDNNMKKISSNNNSVNNCDSKSMVPTNVSKIARARSRTPTTPPHNMVVHKVKQEHKDDDLSMSMPRNESHSSSIASASESSGTNDQTINNRLHNHHHHHRDSNVSGNSNARLDHTRNDHVKDPYTLMPKSSSSGLVTSSTPVSNISTPSSSMSFASMIDRARMLGPLGLRVPPHGLCPSLPPDGRLPTHPLGLWDLYRSSLEYNPLRMDHLPRDLSNHDREQHERELFQRFGNPLASVVSGAGPMMLPHAGFPPRFRPDIDTATVMRELERERLAALERNKHATGLRVNDSNFMNSSLLPTLRNSSSSPLVNNLGFGHKSNSPLSNSLNVGGGPPPLIPSSSSNQDIHHPHQRRSPINNIMQKYNTQTIENSSKETKKDSNNLSASTTNHEVDHQSR